MKPLAGFYKHKAMADGHLNKCIECVKTRVNKYRYDNIEKITEYEKRRYQEPERHAYSLRNMARYRKDNPDKTKARNAVSNAIRDGRLIRQPCLCGEVKVEAHHTDYSKPLDVVWMCSKCHGREHRKEENK